QTKKLPTGCAKTHPNTVSIYSQTTRRAVNLKFGIGSTPDKMMGFLAFIGFSAIGLVAINVVLKWLMEND
ncbi:hypothetical protein UFOVP668_58, partial [uncultured Caudovirales phage]